MQVTTSSTRIYIIHDMRENILNPSNNKESLSTKTIIDSWRQFDLISFFSVIYWSYIFIVIDTIFQIAPQCWWMNVPWNEASSSQPYNSCISWIQRRGLMQAAAQSDRVFDQEMTLKWWIVKEWDREEGAVLQMDGCHGNCNGLSFMCRRGTLSRYTVQLE